MVFQLLNKILHPKIINKTNKKNNNNNTVVRFPKPAKKGCLVGKRAFKSAKQAILNSSGFLSITSL